MPYFLEGQYVGDDEDLSDDLKQEIQNLFESDVMRQIQMDYFAKDLTAVLDDLTRIFGQREPRAWQVAWAMDLKTQQGRFPTDTSIKRIRKNLTSSSTQQRHAHLLSIIRWHDAECQSGDAAGVALDYLSLLSKLAEDPARRC